MTILWTRYSMCPSIWVAPSDSRGALGAVSWTHRPASINKLLYTTAQQGKYFLRNPQSSKKIVFLLSVQDPESRRKESRDLRIKITKRLESPGAMWWQLMALFWSAKALGDLITSNRQYRQWFPQCHTKPDNCMYPSAPLLAPNIPSLSKCLCTSEIQNKKQLVKRIFLYKHSAYCGSSK